MSQVPETDFESHRIEGYHPSGGHISIPLISHIEGNLWSGGCVEGAKLPEDFQYVVSLYPWEKYDLPQWCSRIEVRMYDAAKIPDENLIWSLGQLVLSLTQTGKTLVHCQAGLNRSGLIAGTALILSGHTPQEAISLLREKRCIAALCNATFEQWLLQQEAPEGLAPEEIGIPVT